MKKLITRSICPSILGQILLVVDNKYSVLWLYGQYLLQILAGYCVLPMVTEYTCIYIYIYRTYVLEYIQ